MYNMVVLTVVGALLAVFAPTIARFFTPNPEVIPFATDALRIVALGFPFYAWGMVISQSFNGAGDTRTPTLLNLLVFWCWEIPLAYLLAIRLGMGPRGIYVAIDDRVLDVRGRGRAGVPARAVEDEAAVGVSPERSEEIWAGCAAEQPWGGGFVRPMMQIPSLRSRHELQTASCRRFRRRGFPLSRGGSAARAAVASMATIARSAVCRRHVPADPAAFAALNLVQLPLHLLEVLRLIVIRDPPRTRRSGAYSVQS